MPSSQWCFADFHLDPDNACLWRGTQRLALTLKALGVASRRASDAAGSRYRHAGKVQG
jgi:hypothetical protein